MIRLTPITLTELKPLIELAFMNDIDLITSIHVSAPATLLDCVNATYNNLMEHQTEYGIGCFRVDLIEADTKPIGFVCTIMQPEIGLDMLISFGINIRYRTSIIKHEWLKALELLFGGREYKVALWSRNTRAIKFFQNNGFNNIKSEKNFVILWQSSSQQQ